MGKRFTPGSHHAFSVAFLKNQTFINYLNIFLGIYISKKLEYDEYLISRQESAFAVKIGWALEYIFDYPTGWIIDT